MCGTEKSSDQKHRNHFYFTEPKIVRYKAAEPLKFNKIPIFFSSVVALDEIGTSFFKNHRKRGRIRRQK
jgi:hypothetical protein